jgi:NTP pyrophosphatase (non-canonical NTP hydrolase)
MTDLDKLTKLILKFRKDRNWKQFHKPKDMAISLSLEASEVLEHFQWKTEEEVEEYLKTHKDHIGEELIDVLWWILLICHDLNINIDEAFKKKLKKNSQKYPVEKSKNSHKKWSELE